MGIYNYFVRFSGAMILLQEIFIFLYELANISEIIISRGHHDHLTMAYAVVIRIIAFVIGVIGTIYIVQSGCPLLTCNELGSDEVLDFLMTRSIHKICEMLYAKLVYTDRLFLLNEFYRSRPPWVRLAFELQTTWFTGVIVGFMEMGLVNQNPDPDPDDEDDDD